MKELVPYLVGGLVVALILGFISNENGKVLLMIISATSLVCILIKIIAIHELMERKEKDDFWMKLEDK